MKRDGIAVFGSIMELPSFQDKVRRVADAYDKGVKVCLMCSELAPENCHRSRLIGIALHERDIEVTHIDRDGRPIPHLDVMSRVDGSQPKLFEE